MLTPVVFTIPPFRRIRLTGGALPRARHARTAIIVLAAQVLTSGWMNQPAKADQVPGAASSGTTSVATGVTLSVSSDGSAVTFSIDAYSNRCDSGQGTYSSGLSVYPNIPISNHAFSLTNTGSATAPNGQPYTFSNTETGSFTGTSSASGTVENTFHNAQGVETCHGTVSWTATTTGAPTLTPTLTAVPTATATWTPSPTSTATPTSPLWDTRNLIDGHLETGWRSMPGHVSDQWIRVQLAHGQPVTISDIMIDPAAIG